MNKNQAAAYVQSQAACALLEAFSMLMKNIECESKGNMPPIYKPEAFYELIEKYGIHHNAVHEYLFVNDRD